MTSPIFSRSSKGKYIGDPSGPLYFSMLDQIFTEGVKRFGEDTPRREKFVQENVHLISCSVLCLLFAYLESTLGSKSKEKNNWIVRHGGKAQEELECLQIVRNAFVHTNSIVTDLESVGAKELAKLNSFITRLGNGEITDDKGNVYPQYMTLTNDGKVLLTEDAILTFTSLGRALSH